MHVTGSNTDSLLLTPDMLGYPCETYDTTHYSALDITLPHSDNGIRISKFGLSFTGVRTLIWTSSGIGHWKKMI